MGLADTPPDKTLIRPASTMIVLRDAATTPRVLMGQRGKAAAFMPSKYVFPGGAVDTGDARAPLAADLPAPCADRLARQAGGVAPHALAAAAIRELWEETGLRLGRRAPHPADMPEPWPRFCADGARPCPAAMRFLFRAVTPPGRPRRFDARFFLVGADALLDDPDDFSRADQELSHLHWVPLPEARALDLPFITEVVLAEVAARLPALDPPPSVPFFRHEDGFSRFDRL